MRTVVWYAWRRLYALTCALLPILPVHVRHDTPIRPCRRKNVILHVDTQSRTREARDRRRKPSARRPQRNSMMMMMMMRISDDAVHQADHKLWLVNNVHTPTPGSAERRTRHNARGAQVYTVFVRSFQRAFLYPCSNRGLAPTPQEYTRIIGLFLLYFPIFMKVHVVVAEFVHKPESSRALLEYIGNGLL
jgi:hypothetical protein